MSTREIVQTVRPIAKLTELLCKASNDPEMAEHLFVTDLLKVGQLVASADGVLSERERLAMICVTSLTWYGAYADLLRWGSMKEVEREMHEENFNNLCDYAREDGLENLQFLSAVQEVDRTERDALLAKLADAIYSFADLVAKADGTITAEEHAQLNRLRARLYGQPQTSQSQPSEIPASRLQDPALKVDSRNLAIGTLVTLLNQLSEADLHKLVDHARRLAGNGLTGVSCLECRQALWRGLLRGPSSSWRARSGENPDSRLRRGTLKEQCLWAQTYADLDDLRTAVQAFVERYNTLWLIEQHGHKTLHEAYTIATQVMTA